ncbi:MAG: iron-containing alcohol dehydrogenase [Candidatus Obscuribacterales bacterium]|nr:iron-containing alcohol dehydrogenase [Candidatus Obscuribacterales bacterium]
MNTFVFQSPTKVCFGEYLSATAFEVAKDMGAERPLIITDKFLVASGILEPLLNGVRDGGVEPIIFSDVPPDSDVESVNRAAQFGLEQACDAIIAVGGGSVMDTAKAANICLSLGGDLLDYQGLNNIEDPLRPLVAIPTTAGTGSEVSFVAMIKDSAEHRKLVFGSRHLAPNVAILDPVLLISLPPKLTAATGLDALTHGLEALVATVTNSAVSDALAIESARLIFEYLPRATSNGDDMEARSATLVASTMAGIAFSNSGVGIIHALAHATGARFNTHHGITNAVYLPHGMRFNLEYSNAIYGRAARALGFSSSMDDNEASEALVKAVERLLKEVGLPTELKQLGVPEMNEEELQEWVNLVVEDPAIIFNPREASVEDIIGIYKRAY